MQALLIIFGAATVLLTAVLIVQRWRSQRKIRLQILVFAPWSPVAIHRMVKDKVKVYYRDELVTNVFLTQVKIKNSGNLPIKKEEDVVEPLTFEFGEETKIVDWDVISREPKELRLDLQLGQKENQLQCNFQLLNEKEQATLQIICFGAAHRPKPHVRIAGAKLEMPSFESLSEITGRSKGSLRDIVAGSVLLVSGVFFGLVVAGVVFGPAEPDPTGIVFSVMFGLGGLFILLGGIGKRRLRRFL